MTCSRSHSQVAARLGLELTTFVWWLDKWLHFLGPGFCWCLSTGWELSPVKDVGGASVAAFSIRWVGNILLDFSALGFRLWLEQRKQGEKKGSGEPTASDRFFNYHL